MILCQKTQITPSELIFIDDTERSLDGAKTIGYNPILYKNNEQLEKDLSNLLSAYL